MTVPSRAAPDRSPGELYGWLIVGVGFVVLSVSFSARSLLSLAMPYIEGEFGWSRSFVSNAGAAALVVMAIVAPLAGNLVDRFGPRILLAGGLAAVGIGMGLTAAMGAAWHFVLAFSVVAGIGFGMAANHVVATIVSLQFQRHRGLAVGAATSGSTAGQLLVVPLLAGVLATTDWRWSYLALGLVSLALIPVVLALMRGGGSAAAAAARRAPSDPLLRRLGLLLRSPVFHLLLWSYTICGFTTAGVIEGHLIPYAVACGFPPLESATAYGVLSGINFGGMILAGWLTDRMNRPLLLGSIYVLRGLSFLILMSITGNLPLLFLFAVVFGLFDYSTVPVTASLVASHIGLRMMGLTMGILSAGHALGAALGLSMAGKLYDLFAQYAWTWWVSLGLALVAGVLCYLIRENRHEGAGARRVEDALAPAPAGV
jgi:MFS family permease